MSRVCLPTMKQWLGYVTWVAGALLMASCAPDPLTGVYRGPSSEAIKIEPDSMVQWQPPKKTSLHPDEFQFLGRLYRHLSVDGVRLITPSASRYLGTGFSVSDDRKTITLDWVNKYAGTSGKRSVRYVKE